MSANHITSKDRERLPASLRAYRRRRKLSQADAAAKLSASLRFPISKRTLEDWEQGRFCPVPLVFNQLKATLKK